MKKIDASVFEIAVRVLHQTGHLWEVKQEDLYLLKPSDQVFIDGLIRFTKLDSSRYTRHVINAHGRLPTFDGEVGPAVAAMVTEEGGRCWVPDIAPPPDAEFQFEDPALQLVAQRMQLNAVMAATGAGNWAGCWGVGNYHCAICQIDDTNLPSHVRPVWLEILKECQEAYAVFGLLIYFVDRNMVDLLTGKKVNGTANTKLKFVMSSSGWIGLAIVGQGETCGDVIWIQLLATFARSEVVSIIKLVWWALLTHEFGHNCGFGHTNGGIMNPSLIRPTRTRWEPSDPTVPKLKLGYGGQPVPIPGSGPTPPAPPVPPIAKTVEERLWALELQANVHGIALNHLAAEVKKLGD